MYNSRIEEGRNMKNVLQEFKEYIKSFPEDALPLIAIVSHDNPDPDSLGAALGMQRLLRHWNSNIKTNIVYGGEISHPQNKTMVNLLGINPMRKQDIKEILESTKAFIVVDSLPDRSLQDIECLFTIDHHKGDTKKSKFKDIRPVGATCSIIWEYFKQEGLTLDKSSDIDADIATAMAVGIKTDTSDLSSDNVTDLDFDAYKSLIGFVNQRKLAQIIRYPLPPYHFELRSRLDQEKNSISDSGVFIGGIGYIVPSKRDALPTIAEERARVEGTDTAFIFAIVGSNIELSVRSNGLSLDVNAICQNLFGKDFGGGKMGAGAARIPMGILAIDSDPPEIQDKMWEAIRDKIQHKILTEMSRYR